MLRLAAVFATVLALAFLVVGVAPAPAEPEEKKVLVEVACHEEDPGPGRVTVDPWLLHIEERDTVKWTLHIADLDPDGFIVSPKEPKQWLFEEIQHEGNEARGTGWKGKPSTDYDYNIKVSCKGYEFVIDPRVRVGP